MLFRQNVHDRDGCRVHHGTPMLENERIVDGVPILRRMFCILPAT